MNGIASEITPLNHYLRGALALVLPQEPSIDIDSISVPKDMMPKRKHFDTCEWDEPMKRCRFCKSVMARNTYGDRMETAKQYRKRDFCSITCHSENRRAK